jgi:hypothetical protein
MTSLKQAIDRIVLKAMFENLYGLEAWDDTVNGLDFKNGGLK